MMNKMEKRYASLAEHVEYLERENRRLNAAIQLLLSEKAQWVQSKGMQQQIIYQQLTASNKEINGLGAEVQRLKEENRRLRNEEQCH